MVNLRIKLQRPECVFELHPWGSAKPLRKYVTTKVRLWRVPVSKAEEEKLEEQQRRVMRGSPEPSVWLVSVAHGLPHPILGSCRALALSKASEAVHKEKGTFQAMALHLPTSRQETEGGLIPNNLRRFQ